VVIAILIVIVVVKGIIVVSVFIIVGRDIVVNKIATPPRDSILPKIKFLSLDENIWNAMLNGWETRRSKVEYRDRDITRGVHFAVNYGGWIGSWCPVISQRVWRCCSGRRYITKPNERRHASSWSMRDRFGRRF